MIDPINEEDTGNKLALKHSDLSKAEGEGAIYF